MPKVLLIAILLVGSLASAGALGFQEFVASVGVRRIVALARDDGRYANSPLKSWFDRLASGNGLCCSFADGFRVDDVDWDTQDGHYRVQLNGEWIVVPDDAVVTEPNKFGRPSSGHTWAPTGRRKFAASFLAQAGKGWPRSQTPNRRSSTREVSQAPSLMFALADVAHGQHLARHVFGDVVGGVAQMLE